MEIKILFFIFTIFTFSCSFSQIITTVQLPKGAVQFTPDQMQWIDGPTALPQGTKMCVLYGDFKKEGPFALRLKLPAKQVIGVHIHANDEVVTVLEGSVRIGFGEQMQTSETKNFIHGSFYVNPAKTKHFVLVGEDGATLQINSIGPWTVEFK